VQGIVEYKSIGDLGAAFSNPLQFFRPLLLYISYSLGGMNPAYFRIFGILFHIGVVVTAYLLLTKLYNRGYAFFTAAIFAVHPVAVESVTWISATTYPQYSFFLMLALLTYVLSKKRHWYYYLSLGAYVLSLLSSEKAVVLPAILLLAEISFYKVKKGWKNVVPYVVLSVGMGLFHILNLASRIAHTEVLSIHKTGYRNPLHAIPISISSYFRLIFFPDTLTLYHTDELTMSYAQFAVRCVFTLLCVAAVFVAYRKSKFVFFWLSFFFLALMPTLLPVDVIWVVAERYVYLGALGLIAATVYVLHRNAKGKANLLCLYAVLAVIVSVLMYRSVLRNAEWRDEPTFWMATRDASPSSFNARMNAGKVYMMQGQYSDAGTEFESAASIRPDRGDAYLMRANAYISQGDKTNAIEYYRLALMHDSSIWQSHQNLAAIYHSVGEFRMAEAEIDKAIALRPGESAIRRLKLKIDTSLKGK
jgi:hypothetical protein